MLSANKLKLKKLNTKQLRSKMKWKKQSLLFKQMISILIKPIFYRQIWTWLVYLWVTIEKNQSQYVLTRRWFFYWYCIQTQLIPSQLTFYSELFFMHTISTLFFLHPIWKRGCNFFYIDIRMNNRRLCFFLRKLKKKSKFFQFLFCSRPFT